MEQADTVNHQDSKESNESSKSSLKNRRFSTISSSSNISSLSSRFGTISSVNFSYKSPWFSHSLASQSLLKDKENTAKERLTSEKEETTLSENKAAVNNNDIEDLSKENTEANVKKETPAPSNSSFNSSTYNFSSFSSFNNTKTYNFSAKVDFNKKFLDKKPEFKPSEFKNADFNRSFLKTESFLKSSPSDKVTSGTKEDSANNLANSAPASGAATVSPNKTSTISALEKPSQEKDMKDKAVGNFIYVLKLIANKKVAESLLIKTPLQKDDSHYAASNAASSSNYSKKTANVTKTTTYGANCATTTSNNTFNGDKSKTRAPIYSNDKFGDGNINNYSGTRGYGNASGNSQYDGIKPYPYGYDNENDDNGYSVSSPWKPKIESTDTNADKDPYANHPWGNHYNNEHHFPRKERNSINAIGLVTIGIIAFYVLLKLIT